MILVYFTAVIAAIVLAWILARERTEYRPIALLLSLQLATDIGVHAFDITVVAPLREALGLQVPWTGLARVVSVTNNALQLVYPAVLVATVLYVFTKTRAWLAAVGWAVAVLFFVLAHPVAGNGSQAMALGSAQIISSVACTGVVVSWYRKPSNRPQPEHLSLALIVLAEVVSIFGAWMHGPFEQWHVSQMLYVTLFGVLVLVQGRQVWISAHASS